MKQFYHNIYQVYSCFGLFGESIFNYLAENLFFRKNIPIQVNNPERKTGKGEVFSLLNSVFGLRGWMSNPMVCFLS
ncbi:hypothetical protein A2767_03605 [Candidatus Roizmanbacteria bacterium RIFCSPHIGHO2_01_FULL_35_10]|uniref:Uncharacterized protein n=1 Tax=Candidatus Roizmanbacteria bacterium RIFCSPLOWO2_01_FULL_35_13 TaxID=1802055 RepID=A0A1F7IA32_9BACT|nr:MAG: hypothetical protein A2767_03605 [Candidatus Roizmanbacteria bacterium RIFCSPHIGHO2_01_FULL_35_10]OGK40213.1 MAG: hypothetical protein A3A74_06925 [Candidatus Roizmanbacteria bacterium RIFCSPLOWO2_01_FULL_35_13]